MTFAAPAYLLAAALGAVIVAALHLIAERRPPSTSFPTARFVPDAPPAAMARRARPSDPWLLLLRIAIVLLVGLALARPRTAPSRRAVARVTLVDVSRAVAPDADVAARARALASDALVAFDSAAAAVTPSALDSLERRGAARPRGSLSAGLVAAIRAGAALAERADSLELAIVSPLAAEEIDRATVAIRDRWPGRLRIERVALARPEVGPASATRTAWADSISSPLWTRRERPDTVGALVAGDVVVVAALARRWRATAPAPGTRVVARWADGEPAALERALDDGCERVLGWAPPASGDLVLRGSYERLWLQLTTAPCGDPYRATPAADAVASRLAGGGRLASASDFPAAPAGRTRLPAILLATALALAVAELLVRRRGRGATHGGGSAADVDPSRAARAPGEAA